MTLTVVVSLKTKVLGLLASSHSKYAEELFWNQVASSGPNSKGSEPFRNVMGVHASVHATVYTALACTVHARTYVHTHASIII